MCLQTGMNNKHSLIGNELNEKKKQMELNYNQNNDSIAKVYIFFSVNDSLYSKAISHSFNDTME